YDLRDCHRRVVWNSERRAIGTDVERTGTSRGVKSKRNGERLHVGVFGDPARRPEVKVNGGNLAIRQSGKARRASGGRSQRSAGVRICKTEQVRVATRQRVAQ